MSTESEHDSATERYSDLGSLMQAFIAVTAAAVFIAVATLRLDQPLLERHSFRQTQTAFTARVFHEQGIDLLQPKLPVFGEPFEVPFEFPLFQGIASLVMDAGIEDDAAMRLTGLACFLVTAMLLYGLVRRVAGPIAGIASFVVFLASPFSLAWGRTSMIEYLATTGAVGFTWATVAFRESGRRTTGALGLLAGLIGMLVKPTTAVFWLLPALAYRPEGTHREHSPRERLAWLATLIAIPLLAAALWTRHADSIKAASPLTHSLTSDALTTWNFGTLDQRLDYENWEHLASRVVGYVLGVSLVLVLPLSVIAVVRSSQRRFWLAIVATIVLPPLVFTNLYIVHDYYLAAITPAVAALIGLGAGFAWDHTAPRLVARLALVVTGMVVVVAGPIIAREYLRASFVPEPEAHIKSLAAELARDTSSADRIGVFSSDWSPAVLYYANRWGLTGSGSSPVVLHALQRGGYRFILVPDPSEADLQALERWRWVSALGPHLYHVADARPDLGREGAVVATDDVHSIPTRRKLLGRGRVPCDVRSSVPSGRRGTVLILEKPPAHAEISIGTSLGPLPARRVIHAASSLAVDGRLSLQCAGANGLTLTVWEAASPYS